MSVIDVDEVMAEELVKEDSWLKFVEDFEDRNNYIVGDKDIGAVFDKLQQQTGLGNVLELGCGNGTYTRIIAPEAEHVTATDPADVMAKSAAVRLQRLENVKAEKADPEKLQYEDSSFDTVFMANLLKGSGNPKGIIEESCRVLKDNGQLIIFGFTFEGMRLADKIKMAKRYHQKFGKSSPFSSGPGFNETAAMVVSCSMELAEAVIIGSIAKAVFIRALKCA